MSQDFPFNPKAIDFDIKNAYSLAKVSQLVYTRFEDNQETIVKVISQAKEWGFTKTYFFDYSYLEEDSQGMILEDAEKIILAFRGTEPSRLQDWLTDLDLFQIKRLNGRVHQGFYNAFDNLWASKLRIWNDNKEIEKKTDLKDILEDLLTENKRPIWVTGHSLGGAMAVLGAAACGLELQEKFKPDINLYTYGQPRVGDKDFNNSLLNNITTMFRIVNNNDIVARIPIDFIKKIPALNYAHVGELIYLDTNQKVHLEDLGWWQKTKDEFWGRIQDTGKPGPDGIKDHDLSKYIAILKGALDNPNNIIK